MVNLLASVTWKLCLFPLAIPCAVYGIRFRKAVEKIKSCGMLMVTKAGMKRTIMFENQGQSRCAVIETLKPLLQSAQAEIMA